MCSLNQTCKGSVGKQAVHTGTSVYFMVFFKTHHSQVATAPQAGQTHDVASYPGSFSHTGKRR